MAKPPAVADLTWIGDLKFSAVSSNASMTLDSAGVAGPSPVQALVFALAGCMAMDVAYILTKGRHPPTRACARTCPPNARRMIRIASSA